MPRFLPSCKMRCFKSSMLLLAVGVCLYVVIITEGKADFGKEGDVLGLGLLGF